MTGCSACNGPFLGDHLPGCPVGPAAKDDPVNHPKHYTSHPSVFYLNREIERLTK